MTSKFKEGKFPEIDHQAEEIRLGGGDEITLATLIPFIIIEALLFFFFFFIFTPVLFPGRGRSLRAKNRGHELISNPDYTL